MCLGADMVKHLYHIMPRCSILKLSWILLPFLVVAITRYAFHVRRLKSSIFNMFKEGDNFKDQNLAVHSERWIVVDGTDIRSEDLLGFPDVPDWRILVFGEHIRHFKKRRCSNCIFINDPHMTGHPSSSVTNIKMTSYMHAMIHGAKWIYVTNQIANLMEQVEGFHLEQRVKGLLYNGRMTFDPDRHFGLKDMSVDHTLRYKHLSYKLGDYKTPSVQSKWKPPLHFIGDLHFDIDNVACRLPHAIVPPDLFPITDLTGSLIEDSSFWVLGSHLRKSKSPPFAYWWLWLMRDIKETIGKYPPSCRNSSTFPDSDGLHVNKDTQRILQKMKCSPGHTFFNCALHLADTMGRDGLITQYEVDLLRNWVDFLISSNFIEPKRDKSKTKNYTTGAAHRVILEPTAMTHSEHEAFENPFKDICKSNLPVPNTTSVPPIRDILLIVIFNYSSYYSNILYLDYIYRKFFTNILYCGGKLSNFGMFHRSYLRPINFLEINEMNRGVHGFLCSAYAMEMGFTVSGYLQMSDDVLLNMWNIVDLPRDKVWFQSSIRKGTLHTRDVENITPVMKEWYWWPWSSKDWGVGRLRELWVHFEHLRKTPQKPRIDSFLNQLETSFGKRAGAFYEASDIFYVPDKHKNNFSFFSKLCFKHHLFLEIAIPTMLCGFENINDIVRLNGTYLWYQERIKYSMFYDPKNNFLHPWKTKNLLTTEKHQKFYCKNYLPYVEGKSVSNDSE